MRGAEHENTPRQDGNFLSRLRVAADALPLLAHAETAEGGYLHLLAPRQGVADLMQHRLDQLGGIAARQTDLPIDRLGKRSEEHTSELQSLMRISYAVFCLKKTNNINKTTIQTK